jgi:glycosyltransferase involved in cell wall biosynthesis
LIEYVIFPVSAAYWLARRASEFDVVQVANPPDWLVIAAGLWKLGAPKTRRVVLDLHDPMPELMAVKTTKGVLSAVLGTLERLSCGAADAVIASSMPFAERLASAHGTKAVVVRNGVDLKRFPLTKPTISGLTQPIIKLVYVGTVAERFGVDVATQAVAILRGRGLEVELDVFGGGQSLECVRRLLEQNRIEGVTLHGQVPSSVMSERIKGAAIGLVPYRDSSFMRLVESTKAFEYAMSGLAVVSSDLPSVRSQLGDEGATYVKPGDPLSLAEGILRIIRDPAAAHRQCTLAQKKASASGWSEFEELYVSTVTGGAAS